MSNQDCNYTDQRVDQTTEPTPKSNRWIEARLVKIAELPEAVAANMSRFFGELTEAFDDITSAIWNVVTGDGIEVNELVNGPVEICTETPTNKPIKIQASSESESHVTPSSAVMSCSVASNRNAPAGDVPTVQEVYGAGCPHVTESHTLDDYERWSEDEVGITVGMSLESSVPIASSLTATSPSEVSE